MNRSFRATESQMRTALRQSQLEVFRSSSFVIDRDDELALFHQMKNCENENDDLLLRDSAEEFVDAAFGSNRRSSRLFDISSSTDAPMRKTGADDFLNSEIDKNDYEWLLTPPGTPLFPSLEMETKKTVMSQLSASTTRPMALKSRLANPPSEHSRRTNLGSKQQASSPGLSSSGGGTRRPLSSSGNPGSRPATPTGRSTLTTSSKSSRPSTPTSRTSIPSTPNSRTSIPSTRTTVATTKPVVSSTKTTVPFIKTTTVPATRSTIPSAKLTVPSAKPTVPSRSSTPLSRNTTRPSTPTSRPTLSTSRPASRASTPTRRPSTPSNASSISAPPDKTSSISKPTPVVSKQPIPSRGTSPTVRSRPWKPSEMPDFSLDAPPNLRTTLPERSISATRGRPGAPSARSSSIEPASSGRPMRQSCSPSRGRPANGISHTSGSSMPAVNRGYSKVNDKVSPVAMGTKMVERVINMRKLAPPRPDVKNSPRSLSGKSSSSPDNSGFGRTLSKKSLDMALRHMDIRKRLPGNLRPSMTNIPASSMYSVRSGYQRGLTVSVSGSPHATSSNPGSELSVNQNGLYSDYSEVDYYDMVSDKGGQSPVSVRGRYKPSY
ncbi:mucin-5AC-like isoform X1 [Trifolium pratense]|nr:mucin-5AC-like isoform X1 [Trifolium pratense]